MAFVIQGSRELQSRLRSLANTRPMMGMIADASVQSAKALVPRKTGNLARTIRRGVITDHSLEIVAGGQRGVGYAAAVELGTKARTIVPRTKSQRFAGPFLRGQKGQRRGGVLAWGGPRTLGGRLRTGGKPQFFATRVRHPATRAQPYLGPGLEFGVGRVAALAIIDAWNRGA